MKKVLRTTLVIIMSVLMIYLIICAYFTHTIKKITDTSYDMIPYKNMILMTSKQYADLSPYVIVDRTRISGEMKLVPDNTGTAQSGLMADIKTVEYNWTGISYTYFDFSEMSFVVNTPFDFDAKFANGLVKGEVTGHCNRRVTINMQGGFWRVSEIYTDYEL